MSFNLLEKQERPLGPNYLGYVLGITYGLILIVLLGYIIMVKSNNSSLESKKADLKVQKADFESKNMTLDNEIAEIQAKLDADPEYRKINNFKHEYENIKNEDKIKYVEFIEYLGENTPIEVGIQEIKFFKNGSVEMRIESLEPKYKDVFKEKIRLSGLFKDINESGTNDGENMYLISLQNN